MQIKIEVKSDHVETKTVRRKIDGKEYHICEQGGWIDLGKAYPQEVRIPIEEKQPPYPAGRYVMDPTCVYVDRFGKLMIGRLRLLPAK